MIISWGKILFIVQNFCLVRIWNVLLFYSFWWRIIQREKARSLDVFWPDGQSMAERIKNNRENLLMGDNDFLYILFEVTSINSVIFLNTCEAYGVVLAFFLSDFWTSEDTPIWRPTSFVEFKNCRTKESYSNCKNWNCQNKNLRKQRFLAFHRLLLFLTVWSQLFFLNKPSS